MTPLYLLLARANYADGEPDCYSIPVTLLDEDAAKELLTLHPRSGIMRVDGVGDAGIFTLCEATWEPTFWQQLLSQIGSRTRLRSSQGMIAGTQTAAFSGLMKENEKVLTPVVHGGEQSNTSAMFDDRFILKLFRRITPGVNPDLEIGRELTEHSDLPIVPQVAGAIEYRADSGKQYTLGVLHELVPNVGDAWKYTLDELNRYFERVQSAAISEFANRASEEDAATGSLATGPLTTDFHRSVLQLSAEDPPVLAQHMIGGFLSLAEKLGQRIGELHVALAHAGGAAFAPEPFTRLYQRSLYQSMRGQARGTFEMLRSQAHRLSDQDRERVEQLLGCQRSLYAKFGELTHGLIEAERIRCHGDLHLGQVLYTGTDFVIIDFEGEPERAVSERRIKVSPLKDVAGMLRSFHYAAHAALRGQSHARIMQHPEIPIEQWADYWSRWVSASFLRSYLEAAKPGGFLPMDDRQLETLLRAYLLEKTLYELRYELNNRPEWISIPLEGLSQYCGTTSEIALA